MEIGPKYSDQKCIDTSNNFKLHIVVDPCVKW